MKGYDLTKVWDINSKLVVADTIEDAIKLYRIYCPEVEIKIIKNIYPIGPILIDRNAIIAPRKEDKE